MQKRRCRGRQKWPIPLCNNYYIKSNKLFARLGYNLADATALGDAAAIFFTTANVGTERLPMEDAVKGITSIMKANYKCLCVWKHAHRTHLKPVNPKAA